MRNKQLGLILFLIIELYIFVMIISFNNLVNSNILSFTSIFLCFIIGLFLRCKTRDYYLMITSLLMLLVGDLFNLFFPKLSIIWLISLNLVQVLFFLRIYLDSEYKKSNLISRCISIPIFIAISYFILKEKNNYQVILWLIFMVNLFINILFTIKEIGLNNLFPIGLLLMLLFGFSIMFLELNNYISVNVYFLESIDNLPFDLKSIFYLPSIIVLTCSIFTVNRRCFSKEIKK